MLAGGSEVSRGSYKAFVPQAGPAPTLPYRQSPVQAAKISQLFLLLKKLFKNYLTKNISGISFMSRPDSLGSTKTNGQQTTHKALYETQK
jgi:hypothetical protein